MSKDIDLLNGSITNSIIRLSLPLMGTAFIQMAYSLVDLIWVGKLSTEAVAAVGCCGFFIWIAQSLILISRTGLSVGMSQAYGKRDNRALVEVARSGFQVNFLIWTALTFIYTVFRDDILGFYRLDYEVEILAVKYFNIITFGLIFTFWVPAIESVYYARGNSTTPFKVSTVALIFNIIADPILIFGVGPFPNLGIEGAAIATVLAQAIAFFIFIYLGIKDREIYVRINYLKKVNINRIIYIFKLGVPASLQSIIHALVGIRLNRFIADFGAASIAAFAIGAQIESVSWMSAEGFSTAFSSIFGQNYGAKNFERILECRKKGLKILTTVGVLAASLLFFAREPIFKIFINDMDVIKIGSSYLMINAISEIFMVYEIGTTGMLNGLGLTKYPAINAVIFNVFRIPMAIFLIPIFGVDGIWAAISISSVIKGIVIIICYKYISDKTSGFRENMNMYVSKMDEII